MHTRIDRGFTPARIVALAVIGLVVGGLVSLRFATNSNTVSVPAGAGAGDMVLEPCSYETEAGAYEADCGTLVVPEDRADPHSRLIALPVVRVHARAEHPAEPIFRLEGGPGMTNMEFRAASRFADDHDVVLVGYRGVDGSVRLDCPEVRSALEHSADILAEGSFRSYAQAFRRCADRLTDEGIDLPSYGLMQQVDDLEAARGALGYERVNLLSESAGTRTAMIYAWRYPESIHRSVMVGVNPPGHFLFDPNVTNEQIARIADLCASDPACGARTDDLAATLDQTIADLPDRWLLLPIKEGNVRLATFFNLMGPTSQVGGTLDAALSAAEGDASGSWFESILGDLIFPRVFVWGQYAAAASLDFAAGRDYFADGHEVASGLAHASNSFSWGGGRLADAWPVVAGADGYSRVRASGVEILLIGGELDTSTPPRVAREELLPYLTNGQEVILPGFGHTPSFWAVQPEAGTRLITTYFDTGRVDDSRYEPQSIEFTPTMTLTALAKTVASVTVGLALLAIVLLLWMVRRVRRKGGFGPKGGAALRSVVPIVLGLGGWCFGVLVILVTGLTVPLDDELVAVLAAGAPIGLGVYLAWIRPDDQVERTRRVGLVAAMAGALGGGWLGFHATTGFLALVTTILGATVGSNLDLIVLDISLARRDIAPAIDHRGYGALRSRTFWRHFAEMVVAMYVGMALGSVVFTLVLGMFGMTLRDLRLEYPAAFVLYMAGVMTVPMIAWMHHRGHSRRLLLEMTAAMVIPGFALLCLYWLGVTAGPACGLYCALMGPAMFLAMLYRRDEYTGHSMHAGEEARGSAHDAPPVLLPETRAAETWDRAGAHPEPWKATEEGGGLPGRGPSALGHAWPDAFADGQGFESRGGSA